jgi:insertion element IS1 protein InsB
MTARRHLSKSFVTLAVIAFHVGDRSRESGAQLWAKVPQVYQRQAVFHTDLYAVYKGVFPPERHKPMTKKARKTHHVECFNNPLRQRVSRLMRETLSFSKKLANHIGAIRHFICHYNRTRTTALPV